MVNYIKAITEFIQTGAFNYNDLAARLDVIYIEGKISKDERDNLLNLAGENAADSLQIDMMEKIAEIERRVYALEHPAPVEPVFPIWTSGYTTQKGETVQYDYDKDGNMDLLRYDGGRAYTALSPGKIEGWHVVTASGEILGTFHGGEFTPINSEV